MNIIAIDVHISTLDFNVVNKIGKVRMKKSISTSEKGMIEFIKSVPKPRKIYIEEGQLSSWVVETCHRFGETVVVADPRKNRWISESEEKNDGIDAYKLAQLARGGYIKEIPHSVGPRRRFRELILFYHDLVRSQTRIKNKIKSKFRQYGVPCSGITVYKKQHQMDWSRKLPDNPMIHFMLQRLFNQLEQIQNDIELTTKLLKKQDRLFPEIKRFREIPGIGLIHASTVSALIEDPNRFSKRTKVWKYAGLGLIRKTSGGKVYLERLTRNYNRLLKYSMKQAALATIQSKPNRFSEKYTKLVSSNVHPNRALLSVSRSMLSTMWTIWKKGESFNPKSVRKNN